MKYMAFDIGGSAVKYAVIDHEAVIFDKGEFLVSPNDLEKLIQDMVNIVEQYKEQFELSGIALSAPGSVNNETGFIGGASAVPCLHHPDANIREMLEKPTQLKVAMENDANCAGLAEVWRGVAKNENDVLFIVSGSGIGGAVIKDKKLHTGAHLYGGEFGYMIHNFDFQTGELDVWSTVGSTNCIVRNVLLAKGLMEENNSKGGSSFVVQREDWNGKRVFEEAEKGDEDCIRAINTYYEVMAKFIFNLQHAYDPSMIVIGGAISKREDLVERINEKVDIIRNHFPTKSIKPNVQTCQFSNDANLIGAVFNYIQYFGD